MRIPIRVITNDFQLVTEIDNYQSLLMQHEWSKVGSAEIRINRHVKGADELIKDRIIFPTSRLDKAFVIRHREIELDENGKASENWIIKAVAIKDYLSQRITIPLSGQAYDAMNAAVESIMRGYVQRNAISPADTARIIPNLVQSTNNVRGPVTNYQTRFAKLTEDLEQLSLISGLGWNIRLDTTAKKFVFDVLEGKNKTTGQAILPPVIFSPKFDSLKGITYTESFLNFRNLAYVAGQGEGVERRVITTGSGTGFDRYELFVDARDVAETTEPEQTDPEVDPVPVPRPEADIIAELTARGQQNLVEFQQEEFLEGEVLQQSPFVYGRDYDLGDMVTVQNEDWNVQMDARITSIKEAYSASGREIEVTFNESRPTLINVIKRSIRSNNNELRK